MEFKKQFHHLLLAKPRYNLKQVMVENCDYADTAVKSKNCYYCFGVFYCEDVYYARYSRQCKDSSGLTLCAKCERCIECIDCLRGYDLTYCQDCHNCSRCTFCKDCFGCEDCFGCNGLYRKKYCMFNEQLTKEEYERRLQSLNLAEPNQYLLIQQKLREVEQKAIHIGIHQFRTEECIGDHLSESKGCHQCYDTFFSEDCLYNIESNGNKDCCDITVCFESERCYSCVQSPLNYNCNFLFQTDLSQDSEFCAYSKNLKNCFGCVYLMNKEYYILNQPYTPEEYEKKVAAIKQELMAAGEYHMGLYFASDYEQQRLSAETDSVIQTVIPK